jgi:hypothetical protein
LSRQKDKPDKDAKNILKSERNQTFQLFFCADLARSCRLAEFREPGACGFRFLIEWSNCSAPENPLYSNQGL